MVVHVALTLRSSMASVPSVPRRGACPPSTYRASASGSGSNAGAESAALLRVRGSVRHRKIDVSRGSHGGLTVPLVIVDPASVADKCIGETEKNLEEVFKAVENEESALLFDEADAHFGKRSDVSDARDRYANIEVAYLLQRI